MVREPSQMATADRHLRRVSGSGVAIYAGSASGIVGMEGGLDARMSES